jgi:nitrite reductase/ring-hydroxylating ferredoxin subunit
MAGNEITTSEIPRRRFLQTALAVTAGPPLCCVSLPLPSRSFQARAGSITVDLEQAPELRRAGASFSVVDESRKINIIVIHAAPDRYVAMDRSCTHGGAQCTYNAKRQTVRCTSLNHAEFDLEGRLLHGRTHGNLRTYETVASASTLEIRLEPGS